MYALTNLRIREESSEALSRFRRLGTDTIGRGGGTFLNMKNG